MTSQKPAKLWMTLQEPIQGMQEKRHFDFDHDVPINQH